MKFFSFSLKSIIFDSFNNPRLYFNKDSSCMRFSVSILLLSILYYSSYFLILSLKNFFFFNINFVIFDSPFFFFKNAYILKKNN